MMLLGTCIHYKKYGRTGLWTNRYMAELSRKPHNGGIMKVKRANRLMSIIDEIWVIHLQKVDALLMIGI